MSKQKSSDFQWLPKPGNPRITPPASACTAPVACWRHWHCLRHPRRRGRSPRRPPQAWQVSARRRPSYKLVLETHQQLFMIYTHRLYIYIKICDIIPCNLPPKGAPCTNHRTSDASEAGRGSGWSPSVLSASATFPRFLLMLW